ncbi:DUF6716 putative glycosyltransferase [Arthrobacter sp. H14]|uniref:DUF6716 putative glycosyltransferase n=1 Tax=Arthrobacter sp. H14 TaxID=1312959 RepID=UPI0004B9E845|nr:DUF6716 putative glycosyltransferase [Arthrobacter sp. H14]
MSAFKIVAVVDSDSYLKFACSTLEGMPEWDRRVVVVRSPVLPTMEQVRAATVGTFMEDIPVPVVPARKLSAVVDQADVVLAAATGPIAEEVLFTASRLRPRPALISALPGVALPATEKGLRYRAMGDAFVTHSHAERRAYGGLADALGVDLTMLVSRLPFLHSVEPPRPVGAPLRSVVFAPQAKVPAVREERVRILQHMARLTRQRPELKVTVKLRAWDGEPQTHLEHHPYDRLWRKLTADGAVAGDELAFETGSLAGFLTLGTALVTVSSTAALEAVDAGLPVLILGDFGVNDELLNGVFTGSGLIGSLEDLQRGAFFHPEAPWLRDNYFHEPEDKLSYLLGSYAVSARAGTLGVPSTASAHIRRRRLRLRLRTALPTPALKLARRLSKLAQSARQPVRQ